MFRRVRVACVLTCAGLSCAMRRSATPIASIKAAVVGETSSLVDNRPHLPRVAKVTSMLEAFEHSSLEGSNITDAINALLQDIQTKVVDVILTEHAKTQDHIDKVFSEADSQVKTGSSTWTAAEGKWTAVSTCIEEEQSLSAKYAEEVANVTAKQEEEDSKKSAMDKEAVLSATLPGMTMTCNAAVDGDCSQKLAAFDKSMEAKMKLLEASVEAQAERYEAAKSEYDTAKRNREEAEAIRESANTAHYKKYLRCNGDETAAETFCCGVASKAELDACDAISKFEGDVAKAQGSNNPLSHSDRASEYSTTMKTMCLLREVIGESGDCTQTFDITGAPDFRELDFKEKDAESLACHKDERRTLSQFMWTSPERTEAGPPPPASSYQKVASQAMTLEQMMEKWGCGGD